MLPSRAGQHNNLYTRLQSWQTRILRLHGGEDGESLIGELLTADVVHTEGLGLRDSGEVITYEALSYTWGKPQFTGTIYVNGHHVAITPTLEAALVHFRLPGKMRYIWADGLSINQADDAEKSEQVKAMFSIFRKARGVLVWLGEGSRATGWLLDTLSRQGDEVLGQARIDHRLTDALGEICAHPWPQRVWVQQEIFAARAVSLHCGSREFTMDTYKAMMEAWVDDGLRGYYRKVPQIPFQVEDEDVAWLETARLKISQASLFDRHMTDFALQKTKYIAGQSDLMLGSRSLGLKEYSHLQDELLAAKRTANTQAHAQVHRELARSMATCLESVILRSRTLEATDMRDKIYALLSMTTCRVARSADMDQSDANIPSLPVDYSRPLSVVYQDLTKYFVNRDRNLNVLALLDSERTPRSPDLHLPSWTPNWGNLARYNTSSLLFPRLWRRKDEGTLPFSWQDPDDIGVLRLEGIEIGKICKQWIEEDRSLTTKVHGVWRFDIEPPSSPRILPKISQPLWKKMMQDTSRDFRHSCEAELGDVLVCFDTSGSWYGGIHVLRKRPSGQGYLLVGAAQQGKHSGADKRKPHAGDTQPEYYHWRAQGPVEPRSFAIC
ncbi:hypothetical protein LTR97_005253 [Elasticomyces elasticus]|uniref:Heterokaryon incompatibility domain-containing protein n=1 Tax=Elasticomyces elasticus TaxID=574655 RepID=A0AAN8A1Y2_9PEZI|nr:hypothetical protein LTR97_005253 [Elasticomyces elasticus]